MSLKTEIPGVNNAVQKLGELAGRMRADDFGFRDNDVDNIDKVIDSLHELETERKKMHEELEKETIKSSVLRHQLRVLPGQIRDEIMEAVMSARMSNANVLLELQEKLKAMNNQITALDKQARELEQENATLHPERELLKQQHEEIISQLNQRMAEKASMQIALNETRDKVRQANQDIVDLEDGILQLKEDLIQERTEARQEKKRLNRAVTDATMKTKEQKDQNVNKKQELDTFQEMLMDSEGKLDAVRKNIRRYETSRAKLEGEERALGTQLSKQLKMNDQTRIKGAQIMNERVLEERNFMQKQQDLMDRIKQYEIDTKAEGLRSHELDQTKVELLLDLKKKEETVADDAERVAEQDATLQASKGGLNTQAEEVGAMKRENIDMSEQIEELGESHKYIIIGFDENDLPEDIVEKDYSLYDPTNFDPAVLAQLNNQIEEYKEQLSKERKERMEIQSQKESVAKTLEDLKSENQIFMTEMTNVVQGGKKQHQELSIEGMQLQRQLKEDEEQIGKLTGNLEDAQRKYQAMFDDYQKRTDMMEEEVLSLEQALEAKKRELEEKIPSFQDLEIHFKQRNEEYDATKKAVVGMKNKKTSLEEQIKRMKREKEALKEPQVALRKELKDKRQQLMGQLQTQGSSTQEMEQEILTAGCKLRAVMEENQKFDESCKKLEAELAELEKEMAMNERIKEKLQADLTMQKRELMKKWEADNMMQEFFASRDKATAEAFGRLLSRTEKRENKIDMITERLKEELSTLGGVLDTISTRRPAESKPSEGSLSPGKVIEAVAGANHENDRSLGNPDTAATLTMTAGISSPSPRSVRQPLAPGSTLNSRLGTSRSRQSEYSSDMTPRSVLKSPHGRGKHSPTKSTTFADTTMTRK